MRRDIWMIWKLKVNPPLEWQVNFLIAAFILSEPLNHTEHTEH